MKMHFIIMKMHFSPSYNRNGPFLLSSFPDSLGPGNHGVIALWDKNRSIWDILLATFSRAWKWVSEWASEQMSAAERASEASSAEQLTERMVKQVAQYLCPNSWLFWTLVHSRFMHQFHQATIFLRGSWFVFCSLFVFRRVLSSLHSTGLFVGPFVGPFARERLYL